MDTNQLQFVEIANREQKADLLFSRFAAEIATKNFDSIVKSIISTYKEQTQDDDYRAITEANRLFEVVAERDATVGLCLMAELYDPASQIFAHDITDGIDL